MDTRMKSELNWIVYWHFHIVCGWAADTLKKTNGNGEKMYFKRRWTEERKTLFTSDIASILLLSSLAKELKLKDINHLQLSFNSAELISLLFFRAALHAIAMRALFGYNSWHMMKRRMQWVEVMKKSPVHREDCYLRYRVSEWCTAVTTVETCAGNLNFKLSYNSILITWVP